MYFLIEACQHPEILRVIYFGKLFLDIIFTVLPIGLILMLMIDFSKAVIASKEEESLKNVKLVTKRILFCILAFITPWIVSVFASFLVALGFSTEYIDCLTNANPKTIAYYQEIADLEDEQKLAERIEYWNTFEKEQGYVSSATTYNEAADNLIALAEGELGNTNGAKYGASGGAAWCAFFVTWALDHTDVEGVGTIFDIIEKDGKAASLGTGGGTMINFAKGSNLKFYYSRYYASKLGDTISRNYTPKRGDIIYFRWDRDGKRPDWNGEISGDMYDECSHVGIVDYVDSDGYVHTIEGNFGNDPSRVAESSYDLDDDRIMGYGSWYSESRSPSGNSGNQEITPY